MGGGEVDRRSIPACAGETYLLDYLSALDGVYPRVCGGNTHWTAPLTWATGLSPRVRGKPGRRCFGWSYIRSIPACAGETAACRRWTCWRKVYPRVCGGNIDVRPIATDVHGLSPRVRGKPAGAATRGFPRRSIPACAGETCPAQLRTVFLEVYPRVCGGNPCAVRVRVVWCGLSPRVRGNPPPTSIFRTTVPFYPRVCGGNHPSTFVRGTGAGLSPRVRGKPTPEQYRNAKAGLSPRVRGKQSENPSKSVWRRSIPACAGETGLL